MVLVAIYSAAFFPLSALPGAAAQFFSIIPVAIIASWLGVRGGLIFGALFIPLLAALSVAAQGVAWNYLAFEGRPAALFSLMSMAAVAGRASDLGHRLAVQRGMSNSYTREIEKLATDRARLVTLGIELANATSAADVYEVTSKVLRSWLAADRIALVEVDEAAGAIEIKHVDGVEVPEFAVGDVYEIDEEWRKTIEADRADHRRSGRPVPSDRSENWRQAGFKSVLRVPLKRRDSVVGYMALSSYEENAYSEADDDLLLSAAQQITPHLRAASLLDNSLRESGFRKAQSEIARAMSMTAGVDAVFESAGMQMEALLDFDLGLIAEAEQGGNTLTVRHVLGSRASLIENGSTFDWDPDFAHLDDEVRYWDIESVEIGGGAYPFSLLASEGFRSVAMVTLMTEGEPIGWMLLCSTESSFESQYTSQLMQGIGAHLANTIIKGRVEVEQKRLMQRLAAQNNQLRLARANLQESQQEIERRNRELQEANQAKNTFLSAVSHELKTPLAIMVGFAELLGMNADGNLADQQLEQLGMVEKNGRHLDLLVSDLVDVSRIESGRLAVNLETTDPEEVLNETLAGLDSIAAEKRQALVRQFELDGTLVKADRARLSQVVNNLVSNACKYSPAESDITISAGIDGNELLVVVADQGLGIAKEDQEKLFTPFFRSSNEEAQKEKGTGLGLVITKSIIEMHGGSLDLDSELGEGTTFTVRMPGVMTPDDEMAGGDLSATVEDRQPNDDAA